LLPAFATHERPQPAPNDLGICQGPLPEIDLRLERGHVPKARPMKQKTTHILLKSREDSIKSISISERNKKSINNNQLPDPPKIFLIP
jgi:hypothetical protein